MDPSPLLLRALRQLRHLSPPSPPAAPPFPLFHLPDDTLQAIARLAGPSVRLVCSRLLHLHGPLTALQPYRKAPGSSLLPTAEDAALVADLRRASCPEHLTSLDLSYVGTCADDNVLADIACRCSRLRSLTFGGIALLSAPHPDLTPLRSTLTHLDLGSTWTLTRALPSLTALRSLSFNVWDHCAPARLVAPLSRLALLTRLELSFLPLSPDHEPRAAALLPTLACLTRLQVLQLPEGMAWDVASVDALHTLCALTALTLGCCERVAANLGAELVRAVAALPALRAVTLSDADVWAAPHLGALSCLQLRDLGLGLSAGPRLDPFAAGGLLLGSALLGPLTGAWAAGSQPITRLEVCGDVCLEGASWEPVALLAGSLRVLQLSHAVLPRDVFRLLGAFPQLQELSLYCCVCRAEGGPGEGLVEPEEGLSGLTQLRALEVTFCETFSSAAEQIARLTGLTRLGLTDSEVGVVDLWTLAPLQRLEALRLPEGLAPGPEALAALQHMAALRICDFGTCDFCLSAADIRSLLAAAV